MKKLFSNMIFDIVFAVVLLAIGIVFLPPVTDIGEKVLDILVAVALVLYLIFFLFDRLKQSRGTVRVLTMVEFALIALVAVGLVFKQLEIIKLGSTCQIIGAVIWLRGCVSAFRGYLVSTPEARKRFSILMFALSVVLITLGTYLFAKPPFQDEIVVYIMAVCFIIAAVALFVYALVYAKHPAGKKKKTSENK